MIVLGGARGVCTVSTLSTEYQQTQHGELAWGVFVADTVLKNASDVNDVRCTHLAVLQCGLLQVVLMVHAYRSITVVWQGGS